MSETVYCEVCGAVARAAGPEDETPCLRCSTYWFERMGWVPRIPMRSTRTAAPRRHRKQWTFHDAEGNLVAEWPPPFAAVEDEPREQCG